MVSKMGGVRRVSDDVKVRGDKGDKGAGPTMQMPGLIAMVGSVKLLGDATSPPRPTTLVSVMPTLTGPCLRLLLAARCRLALSLNHLMIDTCTVAMMSGNSFLLCMVMKCPDCAWMGSTRFLWSSCRQFIIGKHL